MPHRPHRASRFAFTFLTLIAIGLATLPPVASNNSPAGFCLICGERGAADALLNVLLFMPFGMSLACAGLRGLTAALFGIALTLGIELAQFSWIAGRDASAADVLFNTAGVALGFWLAPRMRVALRPSPPAATRLAATWLVLLALLPIVYRLGLQPSVSGMTYYPQWTPEIGDDPAYPGELLAVRLGGDALPRHALPDSPQLERRVATAPLDLWFIAGHAPNQLTTLFAIANDEEDHLLRVSVWRQDLLLGWRTQSQQLRFDRPVFRIAGALSALPAGDSVHVRILRSSAGIRVHVNDRQIKEPIRVSGAWALLYFARWILDYTRLLSLLFVALVVFPLAYWAAQTKSTARLLAGGVLLLVAWPFLFRLAPLRWAELFTAAACALLGIAVARHQRQRVNPAR